MRALRAIGAGSSATPVLHAPSALYTCTSLLNMCVLSIQLYAIRNLWSEPRDCVEDVSNQSKHMSFRAMLKDNLGFRFSLVWLTVMSLFPIAALLLKFNRGRLSRDINTPLIIVFLTMIVAAVIIGGNIAIDPSIVG